MEALIAGVVGLFAGAFLSKGININFNHNTVQAPEKEEEELEPVYIGGMNG